MCNDIAIFYQSGKSQKQWMKRLCLFILVLIVPYCTGKAEVILPEELTTIEDEAFYSDRSMTRFTITGKVTSIGARAFADTALQVIVIPSSVTSIATNAFEGICTPVLIETTPGSVAVDYALQHNLDFRANTVCRALLIGQTDYPGSYRLEGPQKDILKVSDALGAYSITTKRNLTAEEIIEAISTTFVEAAEQDISLLYYSGHGDPMSGALVGIDMEGNVTAAELRAVLDVIPGRKVILVDACYSGALIGRSLQRKGAVDPVTLFVDSFKMHGKARSTNLAVHRYYVMASSRGDEESWEDSYGGVFTNALLESWTSGDLNRDEVVTFEESYLSIKENVSKIVSASGTKQSVQVYPENCFWFSMFR